MNDPTAPRPGSSMARVEDAAEALCLAIEIKVMDRSTRTAEEAAAACGCDVAQIVKSLVFEDAATGALVLLPSLAARITSDLIRRHPSVP